jgi:uncharacterized protein YuzE
LTVEYDKDLDILYIRLKAGKYALSESINKNTIVDLDPDGRILAIEILDASDFLGKDQIKKTLKAEAAVLT